MSTIARHRPTGATFAVIGASYNEWRTAREHRLLGDLFPVEKSGNVRLLVVCGADGRVQFGNADDFEIVTIDGRTPAELLGPDGSAG